jgi:pyruvate-ferredoxin/flavodoxin oxidoreductase
MFRYNPAARAEGKNPLTIDSKEPTASYRDFITSETRYSRLIQAFPDRAEALFAQAEEDAKARYDRLTKMVDLYN